MVFRGEAQERTVGPVGVVQKYPPGGRLRDRQPRRSVLALAVAAHPRKLPSGVLYSEFWESYQKALPEDRHRPVGKSEGQTDHVERWDCTLGQRLGGFVRKTLSFSKSEQMHETCLVLFLHDYNRDCLNNTR